MLRVEVYRKGRDIRAESFRKSFAEDLGIFAESIVTAEVYSMDGIRDDEEFKLVVDELLNEPLVSTMFIGNKPQKGMWIFEVAYRPGVQDPAELSAIKAISDLGANIYSVKTSFKLAVKGINKNDAAKISKYVANEIIQECHYNYEFVNYEPKSVAELKDEIAEVDILEADDERLLQISKDYSLKLNLEEMKAVKKYFFSKGRNPTDGEISCIAQTWSEHCKHKTFNSEFEFDNNGVTEVIPNLFKDTIVAATSKIKKDWYVSVFKDNAGIIKFDREFNVAFKVETHNHPSALDPYGGAGTGIGGVIRDILGAGLGAWPIFSTDVFCFAPPDYKGEIPEKILHPKRIMKGVVSGVRDYGNRIGIPTINGAIIFHDDYLGAPLVYCGTAGIIPKGMEGKKASPGELIVVVGGRTGRDGIHGATFSSEVLDETSSGAAVQIGNAIEEKKLLDAIIEARDKKLYTCITDCGGGGFSSAIGEMAKDTGARIFLEKAPLKYSGLKPWEIWLSESQERMIVTVPKEKIDEFLEICAKEDSEAAIIGEITDTKSLEVLHNGRQLIDMDMDFLHDGIPKSRKKAAWKKPELEEPVIRQQDSYTETLKQLLSHPTIASKEWVIRQYDHEVQAATVIKPLVGIANDGPGDASVVRPIPDSWKGVMVSNGINPRYGFIDPYWMAASAIDESLRNIIATGGNIKHTAILDNFCWASSKDEEKLGSLVLAAKACHDFATIFNVPFISGKDSLNNEFIANGKRIRIPDTLLISAISVVDDIRKCITMDAKAAGNSIYIIGKTYDELGGSHYYELNNEIGKNVPTVRQDAVIVFERLSNAIALGLVRSCHDLSEGGLAVSAAEMAFAGGLGMAIELEKFPYDGERRNDKLLFSESNSRFIVEIEKGKEKDFENVMGGASARIGELKSEPYLAIKGFGGKNVIDCPIEELKNSWQQTFRW